MKRLISLREKIKQQRYVGLLLLGLVLGTGFGSCMERTQPSVATAQPTKSSPLSDNVSATDGVPTQVIDFSALAEKVGPAVVNIFTTKFIEQRGIIPDFDSEQLPEPFREFFRQFIPPSGQAKPQPKQKAQSLGSGFLISADGIVVTNNHVIDGADEIQVQLNDEKNYKAQLLGRDEKTDLAILKIDVKEQLPFLEFADSDHAKVGQWIIAVGNPFGLSHTVTAGIISAKGRVIGIDLPYQDFIQTDASINPGNSGGPMINLAGKVVGVNTAIFSRTGQSAGVGFAIPSNLVKFVTDQLMAQKKVTRGYLGVLIQPVDETIAAGLGLSEPIGALVTKVLPDSPAAKADVKVGDLIVAFNEEPIKQFRELPLKVSTVAPGAKVKMKILREGKEKVVTLEIAQLPEDEETTASTNETSQDATKKNVSILGMQLRPLTANERKAEELSQNEGLLIQNVDQASAAFEAGIQPDDIILQIAGIVVTSVDQAKVIVNKIQQQNKKSLVMLLRRNGQNRFVGVELKK